MVQNRSPYSKKAGEGPGTASPSDSRTTFVGQDDATFVGQDGATFVGQDDVC